MNVYDDAHLSRKLSEVLSDLAFNNRTIAVQRASLLMAERTYQIMHELSKERIKNKLFDHSIFLFGSNIEGTRVKGSDSDEVFLLNSAVVIDKQNAIDPSKLINLLMIQHSEDKLISPGYCLLSPADNRSMPPMVFDYYTDNKNRVLVKNSKLVLPSQGPAFSYVKVPNRLDRDVVYGIPMTFWPQEAKQWLTQKSKWPSAEVKQQIEATKCFVVRASSKSGTYEDLEWRISTSFAERILMFSLNITQLQCYGLMKLLLKTFIEPKCPGVISSFMCKTILFHCSAKGSVMWLSSNLILCLMECLSLLLDCISRRTCSHFIIGSNNLMANRLSDSDKCKLLKVVTDLKYNIRCRLLQIEVNEFGARLLAKLESRVILSHSDYDMFAIFDTSTRVDESVKGNMDVLLYTMTTKDPFPTLCYLSRYVTKAAVLYGQMNQDERGRYAVSLILRPICILIGSVLASCSINLCQQVSKEALFWFYAGIEADLSTAKLKMISAYLCIGDYFSMRKEIRYLESIFSIFCPYICNCQDIQQNLHRACGPIFFLQRHYDRDNLFYKPRTATCLAFYAFEMFCIPKELQYELFRISAKELNEQLNNLNMDRLLKKYIEDSSESAIYDFILHARSKQLLGRAVVDAEPYFYFLRYISIKDQWNRQSRTELLVRFAEVINDGRRFLGHRETALNLLGQCLEQEGRPRAALLCYGISMKFRPRYNVASIHVLRLLRKMYFKIMSNKG